MDIVRMSSFLLDMFLLFCDNLNHVSQGAKKLRLGLPNVEGRVQVVYAAATSVWR